MEREEERAQDDQDTMVVMEEDITDRQAVTLLQTRLLVVRAHGRHSHSRSSVVPGLGDRVRCC